MAPRPGESGNGSLLTCGNIGDDRTLYCHTYNPSKLNRSFETVLWYILFCGETTYYRRRHLVREHPDGPRREGAVRTDMDRRREMVEVFFKNIYLFIYLVGNCPMQVGDWGHRSEEDRLGHHRGVRRQLRLLLGRAQDAGAAGGPLHSKGQRDAPGHRCHLR